MDTNQLIAKIKSATTAREVVPAYAAGIRAGGVDWPCVNLQAASKWGGAALETIQALAAELNME